MIYYIIPITIIIVCCIAIVVILVRRIGDLKILDPDTLDEIKESQVKKKIVYDRLLRKTASLGHKLRNTTKPALEKVSGTLKGFYEKISALEKMYRKENQKISGTSINMKIKELEDKADVDMKEQRFADAESTYIEILKYDAMNLKAFQNLADIYLQMKKYKEAKETMQYILKLLKKKKMQNDNLTLVGLYYQRLADVYQLMGNLRIAQNYYKKAVELGPKNPKYLDQLLKISIILKDKDTAFETLQKLEEADPGNQKLQELEQEVEQLMRS